MPAIAEGLASPAPPSFQRSSRLTFESLAAQDSSPKSSPLLHHRRRAEQREEDIFSGPEGEELSRVKTKRLVILNIVDQTAEWWALKDFLYHHTKKMPVYVNIYFGFDKNTAIVEYDSVEDAREVVR